LTIDIVQNLDVRRTALFSVQTSRVVDEDPDFGGYRMMRRVEKSRGITIEDVQKKRKGFMNGEGQAIEAD